MRADVRRVLSALRWEMAFQARHHFYTVSAVAGVTWVTLLRLLPDAVRHSASILVAAFIVINLQVTAFYFGAALIQLEKGQGVMVALFTAPLRANEYLWVKVLALTILGTAENAPIVFFVFGSGQHWIWLLAGVGLLSTLYALVGVALVTRHAAFNTFLIPSIGWSVGFSLPLLTLFQLLPHWLFIWHPVMPSLVLLEAANQPVSATCIAFGILAGCAWCAAAFVWARTRVLQLVTPATAWTSH